MAYTYVHTHTYIYFTLFVGRSIIVNFLSVCFEITLNDRAQEMFRKKRNSVDFLRYISFIDIK